MTGLVVAIIVFVVLPFVFFIAKSWKQQEQDRARAEELGHQDSPERPPHSHWGGMGRPGR